METYDGECLSDNVVPDALTEFIIHYTYDEEALVPLNCGAMFAGGLLSPFHLQIPEGIGMVGLRFYPEGAKCLLNMDMVHTTDSSLGQQDLNQVKMNSIENAFYGQRGLLKGIKSLLITLEKLIDHDQYDEQIGHLQRYLRHKRGVVSVEKAIFNVALSQRQLERKFKSNVGMTIKEYTRVLRFQFALKQLESGHRDLSQIALNCGHYDQAHFSREFKKFSGKGPKRYISEQSSYRDFYLLGENVENLQ